MDPGNEMGLAPCQIMEHSESKTLCRLRIMTVTFV